MQNKLPDMNNKLNTTNKLPDMHNTLPNSPQKLLKT